jgi:three-Cys-motif partner protein
MKRSRVHRWGDGQLPILRDHSEAKHEILSEYIQKYLAIVCQPRFVDNFNLTLIDGFAGGGKYKGNKNGSPFVMIDAVSKATHDINLKREKHVNIEPHYHFIENDKENYNFLKSSLDEFGANYNKIFPIYGDFNDHVSRIITSIKIRNPRGGGGAIFFLDQDGYSDVSLDTLRLIRNELPKAEVIINISISWLIDFINDSDKFRKTIVNMGLSPYLDIDEIIHLKSNVPDSRYIIESKLSIALQKSSLFPYFRPFFIQPEDNHRGYWLLHLSPHYRAHNAMSEVIWNKGNFMRHYGGDGAKIFEISYKGRVNDMPNLFGQTFNGQSLKCHIDGLKRDIPGIIWNQNPNNIKRLIETTCNNTAASHEMYIESISQLHSDGEVIVFGKSGGKKRSKIILPSDIIIPNRQRKIFLIKK